MKLKCLIIDDEPLAVSLLETYVKQTPTLELVKSFNDAMSAIGSINSQGIHLIFLDINMPKLNGLDFARTLPPSIKVIFTTAYDQYAIESFKVNTLDYLLKPINYAEFLSATNKALEWFELIDTYKQTSLFVKSGHRSERINFEQILYIENQKDYVKFHLEGESESISSLMSMQSLENKLPRTMFMRVHRSFMVNLQKVKTIERNCIVFGKEYIPISDSYKEKFMKYLDKHLF
jgi:DNA-binding LytR/AlgR family response regulator